MWLYKDDLERPHQFPGMNQVIDNHNHNGLLKDTDSEHIDSVQGVFVVVPVEGVVATEKHLAITPLRLQKRQKNIAKQSSNYTFPNLGKGFL